MVEQRRQIWRESRPTLCRPKQCKPTHFDDRKLKQIAYHLVKAWLHSKNASEETKRELEKLIDFANGFHRAEDYGKITKLSEV